MKHRRAFSGLFGVAVLMSAVAPAQAIAATTCEVRDLPTGSYVKRSETRGSSPDNRLVVGSAWETTYNRELGAVWDDGVERWMARPVPITATDAVTPNDVNNSGVVVGRQRSYSNGEFIYRAFRRAPAGSRCGRGTTSRAGCTCRPRRSVSPTTASWSSRRTRTSTRRCG